MNDPKYGIRDNRIWHRAGEYYVSSDEPVMLLRGKDPAVPVMIEAYINYLKTLDTSDDRIASHIESATERLQTIRKWQADNPGRVTHGCHNC